MNTIKNHYRAIFDPTESYLTEKKRHAHIHSHSGRHTHTHIHVHVKSCNKTSTIKEHVYKRRHMYKLTISLCSIKTKLYFHVLAR